MGELTGKTALITGASRGIGKAIAMRFAAEGAAVVVVASRLGSHGEMQGTLEETVEAIIAAGGKAAAEVADLSDESARGDLVARAASHFGPVDIVVNNAAGMKAAMPSQTNLKSRRFMFEMNVNAPIDLAQQALPSMRERKQGWILNISSATAFQPQLPYIDSADMAHVIGAYGASKAALNRYTEALAHEVAPDNVFVNSMAPVSIVLTEGADFVRDIARRLPHEAEPVEMMAEGALELCSGRHVGRVIYSRDIVRAVNRPVKSLDGTTVIGDALMKANVEATA